MFQLTQSSLCIAPMPSLGSLHCSNGCVVTHEDGADVTQNTTLRQAWALLDSSPIFSSFEEEREDHFVGHLPRVVALLQPWANIFRPYRASVRLREDWLNLCQTLCTSAL